ncbi:MAG: BlaR1 family beta-lactam sensor/signal transducer [Cellulosilyticaceae bacterium]
MENLFFIRFLVSSLTVSALTLIIIVVKKVFQKHISVQWHYNIWMIFMGMLMLPFIPQQFFNFGNLSNLGFNPINIERNIIKNMNLLNSSGNSLLANGNGIQDFALSVNNSAMQYLNLLCVWVWVIGIIICTIRMVAGNCVVRSIKKSVKPVKNKAIETLFKVCKSNLKITKNIILGESTLVQAPMAFGLWKTYIVLPAKSIQQLSLEDVNYILLHELTHYKNKDIVMNYAICFFQIIYWFNPLIYWAFRKMRTDREVACDIAVLRSLDEEQYIRYGMTIINFAEILSKPRNFTTMTSMGGSKRQIKNRIEKIAYFKKETNLVKVKSLIIFIVMGVLVFAKAPAISIMAYENNQYNVQPKQVVYEDLAPYFKGMDGSFVLYDLQTNEYCIYNKAKSMKRVAPNSTYKMYSALIALETGVIQENNLMRKWDGNNQPFEDWNQDQDLYSAMKYSVNWYFQELDKMVGKEKLEYYFNQIGYGNANIRGGISQYWMESSLQISPLEQVELLKDFYTKDMPFKPEHISLVKESLKISEKEGAVLSGKTGTGIVEGKSVNGWFIGYVERLGGTFIFATRIDGDDNTSGKTAAEITLSILKDKKIY